MKDRTTFEQLILEGLSQRGIATRLEMSQSAVRYWLNSFELVTQRTSEIKALTNVCKICGNECSTRRQRCQSCNTKIRRLRNKLAAIKLLGGKCVKCGWAGLPAGYDFHHIVDDKAFDISSVSNKSWDTIKKELTKCVLLCRNCHAIEHSDHENPILMAEALSYKGRNMELVL